MESQGAANPGILILTTSLSKPFLRLDKYVTLLQELERHMEVGGMQDHRRAVPLVPGHEESRPNRLL